MYFLQLSILSESFEVFSTSIVTWNFCSYSTTLGTWRIIFDRDWQSENGMRVSKWRRSERKYLIPVPIIRCIKTTLSSYLAWLHIFLRGSFSHVVILRKSQNLVKMKLKIIIKVFQNSNNVFDCVFMNVKKMRISRITMSIKDDVQMTQYEFRKYPWWRKISITVKFKVMELCRYVVLPIMQSSVPRIWEEKVKNTNHQKRNNVLENLTSSFITSRSKSSWTY